MAPCPASNNPTIHPNDAPDALPAFRPDLLAVCRWMADYYVSPVGLVLRAALPAEITPIDDAGGIMDNVVRALEAHDPEAAERASRAHLSEAREYIVRMQLQEYAEKALG